MRKGTLFLLLLLAAFLGGAAALLGVRYFVDTDEHYASFEDPRTAG